MLGDELVTAPRAAELLGYTVQHVRLLARTGQIQATKFGRDWIIGQQAIRELKAKQTTRPLMESKRRGRPSRLFEE